MSQPTAADRSPANGPMGTGCQRIDKTELLQRMRQAGRLPQLPDYESALAGFDWKRCQRELGIGELHSSSGWNLGALATDRWVQAGRGERIGLRFIDGSERVLEFNYRQLATESARFANLLVHFGIGEGERVFSLLGRTPGLYFAALGTLKRKAVFCPLFSQFGPDPIKQRLERGAARVLVTSVELFERKVAAQWDRLPELKFVFLIDSADDRDVRTLSLSKWLERMENEFEVPSTGAEDPALLHFTSGTTGAPKGALHVHQAGLVHYATGRQVLDLGEDDVFWCTADPGWVTGTSYGILAPLLIGVTNLVDEAEFDAQRWYRILAAQRVNVWYTAPTAIRRLMRIPGKPTEHYDLSALRLVTSVGEPLNAEAVWWGLEALGHPIHDNWWQTETGGIMIANYLAMEIRPGSMGRPLPGVEAALIRRSGDRVELVTEVDVEGELALRPGWPSMFRGYLNDDTRYQKCFQGGWYLSGDLARRDAAGYYWFVGRADDIIKTSGHMVGPFEVESALMEHPAVAEAAVIGKPDPLIGQLVKAFVVVRPGVKANLELQRELIGFGRSRLGAAVAPKELTFVEALPKTRSGKILRRLLQARELGLPEGDLSTLEEGA